MCQCGTFETANRIASNRSGQSLEMESHRLRRMRQLSRMLRNWLTPDT